MMYYPQKRLQLKPAGNPYSFYHVIKSEIDLPAETDHYAAAVYEKAKAEPAIVY